MKLSQAAIACSARILRATALGRKSKWGDRLAEMRLAAPIMPLYRIAKWALGVSLIIIIPIVIAFRPLCSIPTRSLQRQTSTTGPRHFKKSSASLVSKPDATSHDECPPRDQAAIAEDFREVEDETGEQGTESRSEHDEDRVTKRAIVFIDML